MENSTKTKELFGEFSRCSICKQDGADLMMTCFHSICNPCSKTADVCPICKQKLPKIDSILPNLFSGVNCQKTLETCGWCKNIKGEMPCAECGCWLCAECAKMHKRIPQFGQHTLSNHTRNDKKCSRTALDDASVFCQDCEQYFCYPCTLSYHTNANLAAHNQLRLDSEEYRSVLIAKCNELKSLDASEDGDAIAAADAQNDDKSDGENGKEGGGDADQKQRDDANKMKCDRKTRPKGRQIDIAVDEIDTKFDEFRQDILYNFTQFVVHYVHECLVSAREILSQRRDIAIHAIQTLSEQIERNRIREKYLNHLMEVLSRHASASVIHEFLERYNRLAAQTNQNSGSTRKSSEKDQTDQPVLEKDSPSLARQGNALVRPLNLAKLSGQLSREDGPAEPKLDFAGVAAAISTIIERITIDIGEEGFVNSALPNSGTNIESQRHT